MVNTDIAQNCILYRCYHYLPILLKSYNQFAKRAKLLH